MSVNYSEFVSAAESIANILVAAYGKTPVPSLTMGKGDAFILNNWTNQFFGTSQSANPIYKNNLYLIANAILQLPEYAILYPNTLSDTQFIIESYNHQLYDNPTSITLTYWVSQLLSGVSRGQVLANMANTYDAKTYNALRSSAILSWINVIEQQTNGINPNDTIINNWLTSNSEFDANSIDSTTPPVPTPLPTPTVTPPPEVKSFTASTAMHIGLMYIGAYNRIPVPSIYLGKGDKDSLIWIVNEYLGGVGSSSLYTGDISKVGNFLLSSAEFTSKFLNITNAQFINLLFNYCLHADPDPASMDIWLNILSQGVSRGQVLADFCYMPEVQNFNPTKKEALHSFIIYIMTANPYMHISTEEANYWLQQHPNYDAHFFI